MRIKTLLLTAIFLSLIHCHASDNGEKPAEESDSTEEKA